MDLHNDRKKEQKYSTRIFSTFQQHQQSTNNNTKNYNYNIDMNHNGTVKSRQSSSLFVSSSLQPIQQQRLEQLFHSITTSSENQLLQDKNNKSMGSNKITKKGYSHYDQQRLHLLKQHRPMNGDGGNHRNVRKYSHVSYVFICCFLLIMTWLLIVLFVFYLIDLTNDNNKYQNQNQQQQQQQYHSIHQTIQLLNSRSRMMMMHPMKGNGNVPVHAVSNSNGSGTTDRENSSSIIQNNSNSGNMNTSIFLSSTILKNRTIHNPNYEDDGKDKKQQFMENKSLRRHRKMIFSPSSMIITVSNTNHTFLLFVPSFFKGRNHGTITTNQKKTAFSVPPLSPMNTTSILYLEEPDFGHLQIQSLLTYHQQQQQNIQNNSNVQINKDNLFVNDEELHALDNTSGVNHYTRTNDIIVEEEKDGHRLQSYWYYRYVQKKDDEIFENEKVKQYHLYDQENIPYHYWTQDDIQSLHLPCRKQSWTIPKDNNNHHHNNHNRNNNVVKNQNHHHTYLSNCNSIHELELYPNNNNNNHHHQGGTKVDNNSRTNNTTTSVRVNTTTTYEWNVRLLSHHGFYRDAWMIEHQYMNTGSNSNDTRSSGMETMLLKTLRIAMDTNFHFNYRTIGDVYKEALISDQLFIYPNIVTSYGYCGTSIMTEYIPNEIEPYIVPGSGYEPFPPKKQNEFQEEIAYNAYNLPPNLRNEQQEIDEEEEENEKTRIHHFVSSRNNLTMHEKVYIAYEMAQSIAILHGHSYGLIIHDDIQLQQWFFTKRNKDETYKRRNQQQHSNADYEYSLKLGDFNRATIPDWNERDNTYCSFSNGMVFGNYRSPEEIASNDLDENIDIYSFGNNIYTLLTGLWPFYENTDDQLVQDMIQKGKRPCIDPALYHRQDGNSSNILIKIMEGCWHHDPKQRYNIFTIVDMLKTEILMNNNATI